MNLQQRHIEDRLHNSTDRYCWHSLKASFSKIPLVYMYPDSGFLKENDFSFLFWQGGFQIRLFPPLNSISGGAARPQEALNPSLSYFLNSKSHTQSTSVEALYLEFSIFAIFWSCLLSETSFTIFCGSSAVTSAWSRNNSDSSLHLSPDGCTNWSNAMHTNQIYKEPVILDRIISFWLNGKSMSLLFDAGVYGELSKQHS